MVRHQQAISRAHGAVEEAEFNDLVKRYIEAITPAISLAREIHAKAGAYRLNTTLSGYLLDVGNPCIGNYRVTNSGEIGLM